MRALLVDELREEQTPELALTDAEVVEGGPLLELGDFVSLDRMDKVLNVEHKLMAKLDRVFEQLCQIKAMKSLMGERDVPAPALAGATPVLELTATTSTAPDALVHAPECAGSATDQ